MASIRRTLSPGHHDRSHLNGAVSSPPCVGSPSHKLFSSTGKHSSSSSSSLSSSSSSSSSSFLSFSDASLRRFLPAAFPQKRKGFRRFFYRCLPFFVLGFLLGIFPFGQVDTDIRHQDLSFEIKSSHFNVRLDENDNRSFKHNDFAVNTVSFGVDTPADYVSRFDYKPRKQLIVVSPTYNRALQAFFLNKLGQVLRLVQPPLLWIVVEMNTASTETGEILSKTGVMYRHLVCAKNLTNVKDQRVHQRNVALEHIETHRLDGIVYFANDDNVYSLELLESMRAMGRFGTWPVAILAQGKNKAILEGPVCNGSEVIGWHANEKSKQLCRFHVDMSGFAFNSTILWEPKRWRRHFPGPIRQLDTVKEGFQETTFIQQLVEDESQMEGEPQGCSRILNWHLHLDAHDLIYPRGWLLQKNLDIILPI